MPETVTDVSPEGAPAEPSSVEVDHPVGDRPVTVAELRRFLYEEYGPVLVGGVRESVANDLSTGFRGLQGLLDKSVNEIRKEFGMPREEAVAMKALAAKYVDPAELQTAKERAEKEQLEARIRELEARRAEPQEPAAAPQRPDPVAEAYYEHYGPRFKRLADRQGVDFQAAQARFPKQVPVLPNGRPNWSAYEDECEGVINEMAAEVERTRTQRTRVDATRPAGSAAPKRFTRDDIAKMTPDQYREYRAAIIH